MVKYRKLYCHINGGQTTVSSLDIESSAAPSRERPARWSEADLHMDPAGALRLVPPGAECDQRVERSRPAASQLQILAPPNAPCPQACQMQGHSVGRGYDDVRRRLSSFPTSADPSSRQFPTGHYGIIQRSHASSRNSSLTSSATAADQRFVAMVE